MSAPQQLFSVEAFAQADSGNCVPPMPPSANHPSVGALGCVSSMVGDSTTGFATLHHELRECSTGRRWVLSVGQTIVGRGGAALEAAVSAPDARTLSIDSGAVSRSHATIVVTHSGDAWIADLGSTNGTHVATARPHIPSSAAAAPLLRRDSDVVAAAAAQACEAPLPVAPVPLRLTPMQYYYQLLPGSRVAFGDVECVYEATDAALAELRDPRTPPLPMPPGVVAAAAAAARSERRASRSASRASSRGPGAAPPRVGASAGGSSSGDLVATDAVFAARASAATPPPPSRDGDVAALFDEPGSAGSVHSRHGLALPQRGSSPRPLVAGAVSSSGLVTAASAPPSSPQPRRVRLLDDDDDDDAGANGNGTRDGSAPLGRSLTAASNGGEAKPPAAKKARMEAAPAKASASASRPPQPRTKSVPAVPTAPQPPPPLPTAPTTVAAVGVASSSREAAVAATRGTTAAAAAIVVQREEAEAPSRPQARGKHAPAPAPTPVPVPGRRPLVACCSGFGSAEKTRATKQIAACGGRVVEEWGATVTAVVVTGSPAARTPKVVIAVGRGCDVVTLDFFRSGAATSAGVAAFVPEVEGPDGSVVPAAAVTAAINKYRAKAAAATGTQTAFVGALSGRTFFVGGLSEGRRDAVRSVLEACGGKVLVRRPNAAVGAEAVTDDSYTTLFMDILHGRA